MTIATASAIAELAPEDREAIEAFQRILASDNPTLETLREYAKNGDQLAAEVLARYEGTDR